MTAGRTVVGQSQHWGTPRKYVDAIAQFFDGKIDLDPCSNDYSLVDAAVKYSLPHTDGLTQTWDFAAIFVNPPYGTDVARGTRIRHWLAKCSEANAQYGSEVLALIPVATNTGHWKDHVFGKATCICFLYDTRLKFLVDGEELGKGAPMSCAMVYWGTRTDRFARVFAPFGAPVNVANLRAAREPAHHQPIK